MHTAIVYNACIKWMFVFKRIPGSTTLSEEYYFNLLTYATPEGEKRRKTVDHVLLNVQRAEICNKWLNECSYINWRVCQMEIQVGRLNAPEYELHFENIYITCGLHL